ncbi:hypothetical protein [Cognatazoarcus halotolerans]|uniref:hypothetical protein n=1 Tax=Cognatazoarcus halotolerans TaxID=2686016 RepID=UPI00135BEADA|nr:hypothetical protein [Cognatazoarcus halotolerans]
MKPSLLVKTVSLFIFAVFNGRALSDDCSKLNNIISLASENFVSIKEGMEDEVDGVKFFKTSIYLELLPDCIVMEDEDGFVFTCSSGSGRARNIQHAIGSADNFVNSCGLKIRDQKEYASKSGRGRSVSYNIITKDRQLVVVRTRSYSGGGANRESVSIRRP